MIRAYLVDDERLAIQRLTRLLEATSRVEVVGSGGVTTTLLYGRDFRSYATFDSVRDPGTAGTTLPYSVSTAGIVLSRISRSSQNDQFRM